MSRFKAKIILFPLVLNLLVACGGASSDEKDLPSLAPEKTEAGISPSPANEDPAPQGDENDDPANEPTAHCGNGIVEPDFAEKCDDGNTNDNDGCSSACLVEGKTGDEVDPCTVEPTLPDCGIKSPTSDEEDPCELEPTLPGCGFSRP